MTRIYNMEPFVARIDWIEVLIDIVRMIEQMHSALKDFLSIIDVPIFDGWVWQGMLSDKVMPILWKEIDDDLNRAFLKVDPDLLVLGQDRFVRAYWTGSDGHSYTCREAYLEMPKWANDQMMEIYQIAEGIWKNKEDSPWEREQVTDGIFLPPIYEKIKYVKDPKVLQHHHLPNVIGKLQIDPKMYRRPSILEGIWNSFVSHLRELLG